MDTESAEVILMLHGEARHCADCGTSTIFLPVEEEAWVCTSCDAAVQLTPAQAPATSSAA